MKYRIWSIETFNVFILTESAKLYLYLIYIYISIKKSHTFIYFVKKSSHFFQNNGVYSWKTFSFKYFFFDVLFNTHQDLNFAQYPVVIQTLGNELTVDLTIYSIDQNYQINFLKSLQFFILQFFIFRIKEYLGFRKKNIQFVSYCEQHSCII